MDKGDRVLLDVLIDSGLISSKSEGRRIIKQKGVKVNGDTKTDWKELISIKKGMIIKVGKRKFVKIY
jgi:tyrosyl-tRNA synthetase